MIKNISTSDKLFGKNIRNTTIAVTILWTLLLGGSLSWNIYKEQQKTMALVTNSARENFNKDKAFRLWGTSHGGVYVPSTTRTPPNPNLKHIPERDIETPSGIKLTLMNPAYMVRQLMDEYSKLYGVRGRITSLQPLNEKNTPDDWERAALISFEKNEVDEVMSVTKFDGKSYLRLMRPMITKKGCLKCHGHQGYEIGDIRGGIGVSVLMDPYLDFEKESITTLSLSHIIFWMFGFGGIVLFAHRQYQQQSERNLAANNLFESEERFRQITDNITLVLWMMSADTKVIHFVSPSYENIWKRSCQSLYDEPHSWMTSIHVDDQKVVSESFQNMANTGVFDEVYRITRPDGEVRWIHEHAVPIKNKAGEIYRIAGFAEDITQQKQAEEDIKTANAKMLASERQLRSILFNSQAVVFLKDVEGRYQLINKKYEDLFHVTESEIIGKTDFDIFPAEMAETFRKNDNMVLKSGKPQEIEEHVPQQDGMHTYISVKFPLRNEDGVIYGVCGIATDITARRHAEESLQLSEERHRILLESITEIIWTTDSQGGFAKPQSSWENFTGQPWKEHKDYGWIKMIHEDDRKTIKKLWKEALKNKSIYESSGRVWSATLGEYRFFIARATPLLTGDGEVREWVGTISDVTERKMSEDALIDAKKSAEAANTAKSEFLAVMSHEIRTPLNAIIGMADISIERNQDPDLNHFLKIIDRSGNNLLNLIEDILDLSQIESGRMKVEYKPVDLEMLTLEALDIHTINAKNNWLDLTCKIDQNTPDSFTGDKKRLRQVLLNLIGNAIKFTKHGKVELLVSCPSSQSLQFSVVDTGIGIPEEQLQLIFEPFSQADSSNTREHGGIGLGLPICKRLVAAMNGEIWVESEVGKGSTFHFSIPLSEKDQLVVPSTTTNISQAQSSQLSGDALSILMAEDNLDGCMVIEAYISKTTHKLEIVENGALAVEKIKSGNKYDLILMDIQMPVLDGLTATKQIRAWEKEQNISKVPILALTAHAMSGDEEKSLAAGCDSHITKPITKQKLLESINLFIK
ncbi:MAG: PAS domain S-box protein [Magnetococcales bacterium]|nr:PAS domain S-box protein [Magnetococcales bacterium]